MALVVKNLPANAGDLMHVQSLGQEDPWRRAWQPTPVFLPGGSHGHRSLAGYSPRGRGESDTTEVSQPLRHTTVVLKAGEGWYPGSECR